MPGRLLALQDEQGFAAGLGVLLSHEPGALSLLTPVRAPDSVRSVRFGSSSIDPVTGSELPGTLSSITT